MYMSISDYSRETASNINLSAEDLTGKEVHNG